MNYIPRSAARSMIRAEQKRQVRSAIRGTATGEKIMGALMPGRGYAFPGGWSQDRIAQVQHMKDWTGVCIDKLASLCAQLVPNCAAVVVGNPKSRQKGYSPYRQQLDGLATGVRKIQRYDCAGYSFSNHPYHAKALGVIKPEEELEPLASRHPLRRLIESPNDWDTQYDHDYELVMFQYLCGVAYDWAVPESYHWEDHKDFSTPVADGPFGDYPQELWCIPSHWVWPRSSGGSLVSPEHPNADKLIEYYEIRPWGGLGTAGVIRIPPEQIVRYAFKSPINKVDGWARTQMGAAWIDTDDSIATCQRSMMTNGIYPSFWLEMGEGFSDLTDDQVDRVEAKIYAKLGGENRFGRPFISSQGTKPHPLVFPPNQYAFADSGDQSRNRIIALFGLNLPVLGMSESQTFGAVLANLMWVSVHTLKPLLTANGQTKTKFLARYFSTPQRPLKVWYDDPTPIDPQQLNLDISCDVASGSIVPNEIRLLRGRPPYEHGGDDPILPMGSIPMPLNTGQDLSDLAELVPLLGRQENPAAEEEEAEAGLGSPQVEEPNGGPSKRWGGRLKGFNESYHPRGQPDNAGQFGPASGVPESSSGKRQPKEDDPVNGYLGAFKEDKTTEPKEMVKEARQANAELRDEDSKFGIVPDGKGGWDAKHVNDIIDDFGSKIWTIRVHPLTGMPDAGDPDYFKDMDNLAGDRSSQSYVQAFNDPNATKATQEDADNANAELAEEGSKYKLVFSDEYDLWIAEPAKPQKSYGPRSALPKFSTNGVH